MTDSTDFLVIGAGSAGCIVAARLAEAGFTVRLIEAGPSDRNPLIHVPAGVRYLHGNPAVTWTDSAESGPEAGDRAVAWPHGRVVGGSGSINGMIFMRGTAADYDGWAQAGCTGWDWDRVRANFTSLESYRGPSRPGRGDAGSLPVEDPRFRLPISESFVRAAEAAGHRRLEDLNCGDPTGVGYAQMNRAGRFRASSARAFLARARRTGRLQLVTGTPVDRLVFDGATCIGAACGARVFRAAREVILSAGAINTPAMLMRSGIGDAAALRALGIAPVADRPEVGRNLQDHVATRLSFRLRNARTINALARPPRLWLEALKWLTAGRGVLTTGVTQAMVFLRSRTALAAPDLCLLFSPSSFDADRYGALERAPGCIVTVSVCRPESRGRITLRDADPATPPRIEARYFSDPADLPVMLHGIAEARRILATDPIRRHIVAETLPGAQADLARYVRNAGGTMFHAAGSCRMGGDPDSVVDPALRVRGVQRLRVTDASVMPRIVSGNTNAPTMMIAEHGSRLIARDHSST